MSEHLENGGLSSECTRLGLEALWVALLLALVLEEAARHGGGCPSLAAVVRLGQHRSALLHAK